MAIEMYATRKVRVTQDDPSSDDGYSVKVTRGGKPVHIEPDRIVTTIDEEVMCWKDAEHIRDWFVGNVQGGEDDEEEHRISKGKLDELLETCEKVLNASQLVFDEVYKASSWNAIRSRAKAGGTSPRMIKNMTVAHRLLPAGGNTHGSRGAYDENYLKAVEVTRDWAERMLIDIENDVPGDLYIAYRRVYR